METMREAAITSRILTLPPVLLHSCCRLLLHVGQHVGIGIECNSNGSMAQHFADDFGINAPPQQECRRRMPEVVEANPRQPGTIQQPIEVGAGQLDAAERAPNGIGEYQIVRSLPRRSQSEPFLSLPSTVGT